VADSTKKKPENMARTGRDAISAVKMSKRLTAEVDAWAEAHDTVRADAICRLVELGLSTSVDSLGCALRDSVEIEDLAVKQIGPLLDPSLPVAERERRVRRLTEGPPEFLDERIDLPRPKK
jgi:hypothetical protein